MGHELEWDGRDSSGKLVDPGNYTIEFIVKSCYDGHQICHDCYFNGTSGSNAAWSWCAENGDQAVAAIITLIN